MEKSLIKQQPVCNGNASYNESHEDDMNGSEPQETSVSNTLIFYVNGKEVQFIII